MLQLTLKQGFPLGQSLAVKRVNLRAQAFSVVPHERHAKSRRVLKPETVKLMRQPHAAQLGADI